MMLSIAKFIQHRGRRVKYEHRITLTRGNVSTRRKISPTGTVSATKSTEMMRVEENKLARNSG